MRISEFEVTLYYEEFPSLEVSIEINELAWNAYFGKYIGSGRNESSLGEIICSFSTLELAKRFLESVTGFSPKYVDFRVVEKWVEEYNLDITNQVKRVSKD